MPIFFIPAAYGCSQVTATKLKAHQELRYTTAAGAVIQLMGSDEQYSLVEFPIVLVYNGIHHYLPTAYLSDRSLANWRLAQMYILLQPMNILWNPKPQWNMNQNLFRHGCNIFWGYRSAEAGRDRAKLGSTAATSVPISLTGKSQKDQIF